METECLMIGAGFAGLGTAMHLCNIPAQAAITLACAEPRLIYNPWLVYLPAQRKRFDQCLIPLEPVAEQQLRWLLVDTVTSLSPEEHQVQLASGELIHYAQVVIATGSTARREAIPGGKTYDLFSCDVEDAQHLCERSERMRQDTVTLIIGEPRPGTRTGIHRLDGSFSARAAAQSDHPPTHRRSASAYGTPGRAGWHPP